MLFMSCVFMLLWLFIVALWVPAGKRLISMYLFCFCRFPLWYCGSGVLIVLSIPYI